MASSNFRELIAVCEELGLEKRIGKKGIIYSGKANGRYCYIAIHSHALGRDIASGTFGDM